MMKKTAIIIPAASILLAAASGNALASAFQLLEQSASGLGTAHAGMAAGAEDASAVFYNPAGMSLLPQDKKSFSASLSVIKPSARFSDQGSTAPPPQTLGNNNGGDAGSLAYLPSVYFVMPINNRIDFGLGINAPYGLKTNYDSNWQGRFQGVKSDVKTININPALSFKASDALTLGFGLDYQRLTGEFTSSANYVLYEGFAKLSGSDTILGYNFGVLYQVSPATRLGLSYRSAMKYHLTGNADFSRTGTAFDAILATTAARGGAIYADIKLPDTLTLSAATQLDSKWSVVGDLAWTGWAKIPDLTFKYQNDSSVIQSTTENWRNTWRVGFGAIYSYNDTWKSRFGIAYDQSPVKDAYRTVRLPDNDRTWISVGGQYRLSKDAAIDFGYSHLFMKDGPINNNGGDPSMSGVLLGNYKDKVDILSVQYSRAF